MGVEFLARRVDVGIGTLVELVSVKTLRQRANDAAGEGTSAAEAIDRGAGDGDLAPLARDVVEYVVMTVAAALAPKADILAAAAEGRASLVDSVRGIVAREAPAPPSITTAVRGADAQVDGAGYVARNAILAGRRASRTPVARPATPEGFRSPDEMALPNGAGPLHPANTRGAAPSIVPATVARAAPNANAERNPMQTKDPTQPADGADDERAAVCDAWTARAAAYAAYAVPKNRPFARRLVALLAPQPGERVLDVATGPGVVAIEFATAMGGGGVLATDIAPVWAAWVDAAANEAGVGNVSFAAMSADALDLPDGEFDVAACQFGLMFVPDPARALREMRRVLRPSGRLGIAVWSTADKVAHFTAMDALREALPPPERPAPGERSPVSLAEPGRIERLIEVAGFSDIRSERFTHAFAIDDPEQEWLRLNGEAAWAERLDAAGPARRDLARTAVLAALERYRTGDHLELPSEAIIVTAIRPRSS